MQLPELAPVVHVPDAVPSATPPILTATISVALKPWTVTEVEVAKFTVVAVGAAAHGMIPYDGGSVFDVPVVAMPMVYDAAVVGVAVAEYGVSPSEYVAKIAPLALAIKCVVIGASGEPVGGVTPTVLPGTIP